ncbi:twin-arginine translocation signal domain-containing protein [Haloprofundus halophilus]|uniref:twin-arginine translocation signal domain-containing protein n=1 Tax=Haloprofundus halophilus TaxID=2283527 RepID=UPI001E4850E5|nr:twin-arginine translocation signal domain-containing protein [Haloprofundus halophilus]
MPSNSRRRFLAAAGIVGLAGVAGYYAHGSSRPDVNPATGLAQDTSQALNDEVVYIAGDASDLPNPPATTESLEDADAVLATATADRTKLAHAFRAGKPVAVAGSGANGAVHSLLDSVREDYSFGVEMVRARPVKVVVADPRGDTVETYTFVAEGGWDDPILDPFGWVLVGRVPECDTFVPESSMDDMFEYAGAAHIVGRLPTGETYASRSEASVSRQDADLFVRFQTKLHAAATDGYAVEEAVREVDFADDKRLTEVYPNTHTRKTACRSQMCRIRYGVCSQLRSHLQIRGPVVDLLAAGAFK